jgi:hypothetical protein
VLAVGRPVSVERERFPVAGAVVALDGTPVSADRAPGSRVEAALPVSREGACSPPTVPDEAEC